MWECPNCKRAFKNVDQNHYCAVEMNAVDDYIALQPVERRPILEEVRRRIKALAPEAVECIKWQMPTYVQKENLIHFAHSKNHLGIYPGPECVAAFAEKLTERGFKFAKGSIRFPWTQPIPYDLIEKMVRFRLEKVR